MKMYFNIPTCMPLPTINVTNMVKCLILYLEHGPSYGSYDPLMNVI